MTANTDFKSLSAEDKELLRPELETEAKKLGMTVNANLTTDKLYERITVKRAELKAAKQEQAVEQELIPQEELKLPHEILVKDRLVLANELVRCIVTPADPLKRDWPSEAFEAGNDYLPTIKKVIPYGQEFHVPRIILNMLKEKQYASVIHGKDPRTGQATRTTRLLPAYNIHEMDNLTEDELHAIRERQLATKRHNL